MGISLSLCLITKDEEKNIKRCINSVKDIADEVLVVDTGSKDRTIEFAKECGARIIETKWQDDFSKARNVALDNAKSDWILFLDADEEIAKDDAVKIKEAIDSGKSDAYLLKMINFAGSTLNVVTETHFSTRLYRNKKSFRYKYPIHEQVVDINTGNSLHTEVTDIKVLHYGYLNEIRLEKNKTQRNRKLLAKYLESHPNNVFQQVNMAVELYNGGEYKKALKIFKMASKHVAVDINYSTRILRYMADCYMELKRYDEAYKYIKGAQKLYKDMPDFVYLEGKLYFCEHRYEKAAETFARCTQMGEHSEDIYVGMGGTGSYRAQFYGALCSEKLGDLEGAVQGYIEAIKSNRDFGDAFIKLMNILVKNEKPDEVERFFKEYVDYTLPNNNLIMCKLYIDCGMPDMAEKYLDSIEYDLPGLNMLSGLIEMERKNYGKAIELFDLVDDKSNEQDALRHEVLCCFLMGDTVRVQEIIGRMNLSPARLVLQSIVDCRPYKDIKRIRNDLFSILNELCRYGGLGIFNRVVAMYQPEFYCRDYERLGNIFKENGFGEAYVNAFIEAARLNSKESGVYRSLAEYCIEGNMAEDAASFALTAANLDGYNADNYRILLKVGRVSKNEEFKEAVKAAVGEFCPELLPIDTISCV